MFSFINNYSQTDGKLQFLLVKLYGNQFEMDIVVVFLFKY